jgi:hypothetical protein
MRHNARSRDNAARSILTAAAIVATAVCPAAAQRSGSALSDAGWKTVANGMRHFTGLTCPDRVGSLSRLQVLPSSADRVAGCIYQSDTGISAILRSHPSGNSAQAAREFETRYGEAGFSRLSATGAAASGISFKTGETRNGTRCETLWRFHARASDYTLWMSYTLPQQETTIGPLVTAFAAQLAENGR